MIPDRAEGNMKRYASAIPLGMAGLGSETYISHPAASPPIIPTFVSPDAGARTPTEQIVQFTKYTGSAPNIVRPGESAASPFIPIQLQQREPQKAEMLVQIAPSAQNLRADRTPTADTGSGDIGRPPFLPVSMATADSGDSRPEGHQAPTASVPTIGRPQPDSGDGKEIQAVQRGSSGDDGPPDKRVRAPGGFEDDDDNQRKGKGKDSASDHDKAPAVRPKNTGRGMLHRITRAGNAEKMAVGGEVPGMRLSGEIKTTRRDVLLGILGLGALDLISYIGLREPKDIKPYILDELNMRVVLGQHDLPNREGGNQTQAVWNPYLDHGDLDVSVWPHATREIVDLGMRTSAKYGAKAYITCTDGDPSFPSDHYAWPFYLHPDLHDRRAYPKRIYTVKTEPPADFFISAALIRPTDSAAAIDQAEALANEITAVYNYYSPQNLQKQRTVTENLCAAMGADAALAGLVATHFLRSPTLSPTRRKILAGFAAESLLLMGLKEASTSGLLTYVGSYVPNYSVDEALATLESITSPVDYGTHLDLFTYARTAMSVQKVEDIRPLVAQAVGVKGLKPIDIPADLIYGDAHFGNLPAIMGDENTRKKLIQGFTRNLIGRMNQAITARYPALTTKRDASGSYADYVKAYAGFSMTQVLYGQILYPWGSNGHIQPSAVTNFDLGLTPELQQQGSPTVIGWIQEVLKENNIPKDVLRNITW